MNAWPRTTTGEMVICPNCDGRPSGNWPGGPCTICKGLGVADKATALRILEARTLEAQNTIRVVVSV